jgi:LysM repeat protein
MNCYQIISYRIELLLILVSLVILMTVTGCVPVETEQPQSSPTLLTGELIPYKTLTPSPTIEPPTPAATIPPTPQPSATPFTHIVAKEETLLGIAIRYGISLEVLMAANPGIDARIISIGQVLVIPLPALEGIQESQATPIPLNIGVPACNATGYDGLYCLVSVFNTTENAVESVFVGISLTNTNTGEVNRVIGVPMLNILPSGSSLPVGVLFPAPLPVSYSLQVEVVSALPVTEDGGRYVILELEKQEISIDDSRMQATLNGIIPVSEPYQYIWAVVIAYNEAGLPVGMRKWEIQSPCGDGLHTPESGTTEPDTQSSCQAIPLDVTVYSIGPSIETVEVFLEARR